MFIIKITDYYDRQKGNYKTQGVFFRFQAKYGSEKLTLIDRLAWTCR